MHAMPLSERYRREVAQGALTDDPAQRAVMEAFERLLTQLPPQPPLVRRRLPWPGWRRTAEAPKGVYLWGGVGRGKTLLMDLFFDCIPGEAKERLHFHRFMQRMHDELRRVGGQPNPLQVVARHLATRIRVLCLDEFNVIDIGDAMIIAGLLRALFEQGIVLVTTSNLAPHALYNSGIQRASFLPAIDLLNRFTEVVELCGTADYRRRVLESARLYHAPHSPAVDILFGQEVERLAWESVGQGGELLVNGRRLPYHRRGNGVAWFDFEALCGPPRSQHDYIEIARGHHTVFISDVPQMGDEVQDKARRFILLMDEFYDRRVKLILSAATPFDSLYTGERLRFEFERTASRLQEMQTSEYLGRPHRG
jgi:cell division protein ZapE